MMILFVWSSLCDQWFSYYYHWNGLLDNYIILAKTYVIWNFKQVAFKRYEFFDQVSTKATVFLYKIQKQFHEVV